MAQSKRKAKPATVTQFELARFRKLHAATVEFEALKGEIRERIEAGARVEAGKLAVTLIPASRKFISWEKVYRRDVGDEKADRIVAATPARPIAPTVKVTQRVEG